jgi:hypothetical protein
MATDNSTTWSQTGVVLDRSDARELLVRGLTVVGLAGIALVHLVELPSTWHEAPMLAAMFTLLAVASAAAAAALIVHDNAPTWLAAVLIASGPIAGYLLTRSADVFFDHDDVGNWLEPLALVALFIEAGVLALAVWVLRTRPARR